MKIKRIGIKEAFILPATGWVIVFTIFPLIYSIVISFAYLELGQSMVFKGLGNYMAIIRDPIFWRVMRFTFLLTASLICVEFILGLGLALLVNKASRSSSFFKTFWALPIFSCPAAVAYIAITMFNEETGPVNAILRMVHLPEQPWLSSSSIAPFSIMILDIWQWTPFVFLILLAGLKSLPKDLYDAAEVDGASSLQTFRHITLVMLKPMIYTAIFLRLVELFKIFDFAYALTGGGPGMATETSSLFIYRTALKYFNLSYASAAAYVFFGIVLTICLFILSRIKEVWD